MIQQTATSPERVAWKAAIGAGLIAGVVFLTMEMIVFGAVLAWAYLALARRERGATQPRT